MAHHPEAVKAAADFMRLLIPKAKAPDVVERLTTHAATLDLAAEELIRLLGLTAALPPDLGNIFELPQELIDELSVAKGDELDDQLVTVINSYDGMATLDQILVGLFHKFRVVQKRRFLQTRLYRMPMIWLVEGKKATYTTTKPEEKPKELPPPEPKAPTYGGYGGTQTSSRGSDLDDDIPF